MIRQIYYVHSEQTSAETAACALETFSYRVSVYLHLFYALFEKITKHDKNVKSHVFWDFEKKRKNVEV